MKNRAAEKFDAAGYVTKINGNERRCFFNCQSARLFWIKVGIRRGMCTFIKSTGDMRHYKV